MTLERFTGTLDGLSGSFLLQHTGLMRRGECRLTVTVVPDSGTDELLGLHGTGSGQPPPLRARLNDREKLTARQ